MQTGIDRSQRALPGHATTARGRKRTAMRDEARARRGEIASVSRRGRCPCPKVKAEVR